MDRQQKIDFDEYCYSLTTKDTRNYDNFREQALSLFNYQRKYNLLYQAMVEKHLHPLTLKQIPCMPISFFKNYEVRSYPWSLKEFAYKSSGTTGSQSTHYMRSLAIYRWAVKQCFEDFINSPLTPVVWVSPVFEGSLFEMLDTLGRRNGGRSRGVHPSDISIFTSLLASLDPTLPPPVIYGTTIALWELSEQFYKSDYNLPFGTKMIQTGGFKGASFEGRTDREVTDVMIGRFGIEYYNFFSEYSMSELSSQLYGTYMNGVSGERDLYLYLPSPTLRYRVVDPITNEDMPDGEEGVIQFYDLANVWSCGFIQTEDVGVRMGDGLILRGRAQGALEKGCSLTAASAIEKVREND